MPPHWWSVSAALVMFIFWPIIWLILKVQQAYDWLAGKLWRRDEDELIEENERLRERLAMHGIDPDE